MPQRPPAMEGNVSGHCEYLLISKTMIVGEERKRNTHDPCYKVPLAEKGKDFE